MKTIETLMHCPICRQDYQLNEINTIGKNDNVTLLHANCLACQMSSLAILAKEREGGNVLVMEMPTDLDYQEMIKFLNRHPLTANEVLEIYEKINR